MRAPRSAAVTRRGALAVLGTAAMAPKVMAAEVGAAPHKRVEIFGHRGASALRPEHTLAAYAKAIADGADFIEPDLVISKDGVLIIRHEPNITDTTDVARRPEFADRKTEKTIDGQKQVGWFSEDFTLAELKTLRAIERLPQLRPGNVAMDGRFELVTWQEMIHFAASESLARGSPIGLAPELKHSTYFRSINLPLEDRLLATLDHPFVQRCPLVIQSFETDSLRYLRSKLSRRLDVRLMQLTGSAGQPANVASHGGSLTYAGMLAPSGLRDVAAYADILAPDSRSIIPLGPQRQLLLPTSVTADAHNAGLKVMPYTFRPENYFLAAEFQDTMGPGARNAAGSVAEMRAYIASGIDGLFTDDPALGRQAADRA